MIVVRESILTGITHQMDLEITEEEIARWQAGQQTQNVWPQLSVDEQEFLMTGITPEEWESMARVDKNG